MRQAKPDDVFTFVSLREIRELFTLVVRYLGRTREFWIWLLDRWKAFPVPPGRLTELQERILVVLSGMQPIWTLTGGAALVGFYTRHRATRDLDLFFHHQRTLGSIVGDATRALQHAWLDVTPVRSSTTFAQLDVRRGAESIGVDLVADPTPDR